MDEPPSYTVIVDLFSGHELNYIVSFVFMAVLLLMSAFTAASELVFFSFKRDELERLRQSAKANEKVIPDLLKYPKRLQACFLITTWLMNIGVMTIAANLIWSLAGTQHPPLTLTILGTLSVATLIVLFTSGIPRLLISNNLAFARTTVRIWKILILFGRPFSAPFLSMSSTIQKRFKKSGYPIALDELNQALDLVTIDKNTTEDEKEILRGIVNFGTLTAKQVMRARIDISAADIDLDFHALIDFVKTSGYSRMPVYRETIDKIEGVLYIKDLLPFIDREPSFAWQKLLRPALCIAGTKKIDSLLKDFQEKHVHMALIIDEYGGTAGLITLEDIIEEIFGDINDEFDEVVAPFQKIDDHTFIFEGKTSLHDFCKAFDIEESVLNPVRGESESLGGLILEINHKLPKIGEQINYEQFTFTIESVDRKKIKRVRVFIYEEKES